jgi:hypothetical protein
MFVLWPEANKDRSETRLKLPPAPPPINKAFWRDSTVTVGSAFARRPTKAGRYQIFGSRRFHRRGETVRAKVVACASI